MTIADKLNVLIDTKEAIKSAIIEKGVAPTGGLSSYADAVDKINGAGTTSEDEFEHDKIGDELFISRSISEAITEVIKRDIKYTNMRLEIKNANNSAYQIFTGWLEADSAPYYGRKGLTFCPKIKVDTANGYYFMANNCNLMYVPKIDLSKVTSMSYFFYNCVSLYAVADLDTSNVKSFDSTFLRCLSLSYPPKLDTSSGTTFSNMFNNCISLKAAPQLDTKNGQTFGSMYYGCLGLKSIPLMDLSSATGCGSICSYCPELTDIGGFMNLGATSTSNMFKGSPKISRQSCINIFNNLLDVSKSGSTFTLDFEASVFDRLSDEDIAIATNKGWRIGKYA